MLGNTMHSKALIAMSGGVDSSVAAYLTQQQGYRCIGVMMKLFHNEDIGVECRKTCCSLHDAEDAQSVASRLNIPFYVFNFSGDFADKVIAPFIHAYEHGETPNPCIDCNRHLKFDTLFHRAEELACDKVVTGHYARIVHEGGRYLLLKALDSTKDQSYVLYAMTQQQLARTYFPCGTLPKTDIRQIARDHGFLNADKEDSQDICFVPQGDYTRFIENYTGKTYPPGNFMASDGTILGRHRGIIHYTIGQRRGLGVPAKVPYYVSRIDVERNAVILSQDRDLYRRDLIADRMNWIAFDTPPRSLRAKAKIRYRQQEQPATVTAGTQTDTIRILFDEPQRAITPGQSVVLYDGDKVLGGGIIKENTETAE